MTTHKKCTDCKRDVATDYIQETGICYECTKENEEGEYLLREFRANA